MGYGYFPGGDPRKFYPDPEMCSKKEIAAHKRACKKADEREKRGESPELSAREFQPFGVGGYED